MRHPGEGRDPDVLSASADVRVSHIMPSYVYILASGTVGTIYTGVTSDLVKRISEHKNGITKGFTSKYKVNQLVWYEVHQDIEFAIRREKQIKEWKRAWK